MTDGTDSGPEDDEAFRSALESLLRRAERNDVGLERAWECRTDGNGSDWEVEIVRLAPVDAESNGGDE